MAADVSSVFFTEEDYESFSLQRKFDVNLFKAYNPSIEGSTISPVKKSKPSHTTKKGTEHSSTVQPTKQVPQCSAQNPSITPGISPKTKLVWNLKSPKPRFPYPRYSCMTHAQQQRYIKLLEKHGLRNSNPAKYTSSAEDIAEKQQLRKLQILVHQEQQEFMQYAEHVARNSPKDYEHLPPPAQQYAREHWHLQEQRVKQLPQYFSVCQTIGIVPSAVFPTDPVLTFLSRLLLLGEPRLVNESTIDSKVNYNLILASSRHGQRKQTGGREFGDRRDTSKEVGNDENAVKLATRYQANIVIATTALATLADNHAPEYDKNWRIPVHVKSAKLPDTESTLKTVYVSDPLSNPYFPHQISRAFHEAALHDLLTEGTHGQSSPGDPEKSIGTAKDFGTSMNVDSQYDDSLELDLTSLETFGSTSKKPSRQTLKESQILLKSAAEQTFPESDVKDESLPSDAPMNPGGSSSTEQNQPTGGTGANGKQFEMTRGLLESASTNASETPSSFFASTVSESSVHNLETLTSEMSSPDFNPLSSLKSRFSPMQTRDDLLQPSAEKAEVALSSRLPDVTADESLASLSEQHLTQKQSFLSSSAEDDEESVHHSQESTGKIKEQAVLTESSETEGDLVIAMSSDTNSPQKAFNSPSANRTGDKGMQDISNQEQNSCSDGEYLQLNSTKDDGRINSDKTPPRARKRSMPSGVSADEAPTPRRSRRLQKNQPLEEACHAPLLPSSQRTPKPSIPTARVLTSIADGGVDGETTCQEVRGTMIPDLSLSPTPQEQGPSVRERPITQASMSKPSPLTEKKPANEVSFPNTHPQTLSVPDSSQFKEWKTESLRTPDNVTSQDVQTPSLRYNLRSKPSIIGHHDQRSEVQELGLTGNKDRDVVISGYTDPEQSPAKGKLSPGLNVAKRLTGEALGKHEPISNPAVIEGSQNPSQKTEEDSKISDHSAGRNPKKIPGLKRHTDRVKGKQGIPKPGVESTIDSILKLQERLHSGKAVNQSPPKPPGSVAVSSITGSLHGDGLVENASEYRTPSEGSVDYSLWRFGRHSLVVKSSIDAVSNKTQVATVLPKLEYQPHFGHEQISVSELTKLWMSLLLQPGSKVIQGRVNAMTSDLMMLEHFDMNSALWDQPSFQPSRCMKMMFQVLDKLTSLGEGQYLLCHSAGDMHACILQSVKPTGNKRSLYDLHQNYTQVPTMQSLPWLPLDTNFMLPGQIATGRIPATFPPRNTGKTAQVRSVTKGTSKKKKKKGNKK